MTAAVIRFATLGQQSFWVDETVTARLLAKSFPHMLTALPRSESTPPLYYTVAWIWTRVFGHSEVGLRSLSALCGTATVPVVYAVGATLVSRRTGLIAAAFAALSPLLLWYSQEARAYSLYILLAALSVLFFARCIQEPSVASLVGWVTSSSLALLTHYFAAFLLITEAALLLSRHRRRAVSLASACLATVGFALLPLAAYQGKYGSSTWIRSIGLGVRVKEAIAQLAVPSPPSLWSGAGVPEEPDARWIIAAILLAATFVAIQLGRSERQGVRTSLSLAAGTAGVPLLLSTVSILVVNGNGDVFLFRNVIDAWLPITIVVAAALSTRRAPVIGVALAAMFCVGSAAQLIVNSTTSHLQRDDWRLLARAIPRGPERAVILSPSWETDGLQYYRPDLVPLTQASSLQTIFLLTRRQTPRYSPGVTSLIPPSGFRAAGTHKLQNWTLTELKATRPERVSPDELTHIQPRNASWIFLGNALP
jgi:mannosyltransferase